MAKKKVTKKPAAQPQLATPTIGVALIALGLMLNWGLPVLIGFIIGLVWLFRFSKDKPKLRLLWWIIVVLFVAMELYILIFDIHKFF